MSALVGSNFIFVARGATRILRDVHACPEDN